MTDVRQRAQSRQEFALARLADTRYSDAGANGLARASTRLVDTDIGTAVLTALAIPFDSSRARREALTAILEFALDKNDEHLFFTLATAFPGKEEQANVIRRIVEDQIASRRTINAIQLVELMPAGGAQTRATLMVVDALAGAGYAVMAGQLYDRATASLGEIAVDERSETLAAVIRSSIEVQRLDDTMAHFRELSDYDGLGEVLGVAAGALAKAGRLEDASPSLPPSTTTTSWMWPRPIWRMARIGARAIMSAPLSKSSRRRKAARSCSKPWCGGAGGVISTAPLKRLHRSISRLRASMRCLLLPPASRDRQSFGIAAAWHAHCQRSWSAE